MTTVSDYLTHCQVLTGYKKEVDTQAMGTGEKWRTRRQLYKASFALLSKVTKTHIGRKIEGVRRELKKIVLCGYTYRVSQAYEQRFWRRTGDKATLQMLAECRM